MALADPIHFDALDDELRLLSYAEPKNMNVALMTLAVGFADGSPALGTPGP